MGKYHRYGLARARKSAGFSQERLAEVLRVDRSTITRWECAETEPQPWLRPKLARALGLRRHQLDELVIEVIEEPADDGRLGSVLTGRTRADLATVRQLHDQVRGLGEAYETTPSASLLARASLTHAALTLLLANVSGDRVVQALHSALAASASLMSQFIWDASGRRDGTGTLDYCDQAIAAANETGDAVVAAHAELRKCVGAGFFSPSQFGRLSGSCYLSLNNPERAQVILEETAGSLSDRPKTRSLVLGNLALSFIRQRKLDAAIGTLMDAIDLIEDTRGGGGMSVVFSACRELYPWRAEPAVQEVNDRLLALMAKN